MDECAEERDQLRLSGQQLQADGEGGGGAADGGSGTGGIGGIGGIGGGTSSIVLERNAQLKRQVSMLQGENLRLSEELGLAKRTVQEAIGCGFDAGFGDCYDEGGTGAGGTSAGGTGAGGTSGGGGGGGGTPRQHLGVKLKKVTDERDSLRLELESVEDEKTKLEEALLEANLERQANIKNGMCATKL
jgi:hypothetical protein